MVTLKDVAELTIRQINAAFRVVDESHKWPVLGRFNVTERAIRRLRQQRHSGLCINPGCEYCLALESEISKIVNTI